MSIASFFALISSYIWSWPLIIFMIITAVTITIALNFIQVRYFFKSWHYILFPEKNKQSSHYISSMQAFINTLSASIGNGSTAGMATAMYSGGPGAAFWIFVFGFFTMAVRFAEVYASTAFKDESSPGIFRGGPMIFLQKVPGKSFLPQLYAFFCLLVSLVAGSAMQCNSMSLGILHITGASPFFIALLLLLFIIFIMFGGAQRIMHFSETIVPIKVSLFFITTTIILIYHSNLMLGALALIMRSAFSFKAINGALIGHTITNALRYGLSRSLSATEAGLGTAGVLFGSTNSQEPIKSGIMAMGSIVISNHLVCCSLLLMYVVTGVWNSGLTSIALTSAAYETVFGALGGWLVTFLSITFGMGVLVSYAYIGQECWSYFTKGRYLWLYTMLYCSSALLGALTKVDLIWNMVDLANAGMMIINLYGLLYLLPQIRQAVLVKR